MSKIIIRAIPYIQDFCMENKQKFDICVIIKQPRQFTVLVNYEEGLFYGN